jgi:hypothetical protein
VDTSESVRTRKHSSVGSSINGSFFNLGLTNSATKLSSWLSQRFSSSPSSRKRSALFISLNCTLVFLICESSCSAAVLQSGARCVGVGLGAGVGGEGRRLFGIVEPRGLVGVIMGLGAAERDILLGLRVCAVGDENMFEVGRIEDEGPGAAISVSESGWMPGVWTSACALLWFVK